jgi:tRNA U55 pseudouridine synthase TruB
MSFLVRTQCAGLDIEKAYTADELKEMGESIKETLLPIEHFLQSMTRIDAQDKQSFYLVNGNDVDSEGEDVQEALIYAQGMLLGIGYRTNGRLKINTLLVDR